MRIVFMGYGQLGATVLRGVAPHHDVLTVLTHRAGFTGIGEPDVETAATGLGIPVILSANAQEPELHHRLRALRPDLILSTNWRTRIPREVLTIPEHGAINVHDSLLPRYAGFGAVNWTIRNGEEETGLTVHFMDEQLDTGPVVTRTVVKIGPTDTAGFVLSQLLDEYVPTALRALELVEHGHRGEPQGMEQASFYHRIGLEDTRIDWRDSATQIYNLIRGQSDPFLNAWADHDGRRLFVKAAAMPTRSFGGTHGRIVRPDGGGIAVVCGRAGDPSGQGIVLLSVATESGPPVRAVDYFLKFGGYLR